VHSSDNESGELDEIDASEGSMWDTNFEDPRMDVGTKLKDAKDFRFV